MEKFTMKRPQKADYVKKYGFQGERIWRFELLKYEEAKQAFDRRQANIKAYQEKIKKEQKAIRIGATNAPKKTTAKKTTAKPKGRATAKDQKATPKKTIARGKKKSPPRK